MKSTHLDTFARCRKPRPTAAGRLTCPCIAISGALQPLLSGGQLFVPGRRELNDGELPKSGPEGYWILDTDIPRLQAPRFSGISRSWLCGASFGGRFPAPRTQAFLPCTVASSGAGLMTPSSSLTSPFTFFRSCTGLRLQKTYLFIKRRATGPSWDSLYERSRPWA